MSWGSFFATQLRQWGFTLLAFGLLLALLHLGAGFDMPTDLDHILVRLNMLFWLVGSVAMLGSVVLGFKYGFNNSNRKGTTGD